MAIYWKYPCSSAPYIFGPPEQSVSSDATLNTSSQVIYELISGAAKTLPPDTLPLFVDVRDVAQAHILALQNDSVIGKRVLLCGGSFTLYDVSPWCINNLRGRKIVDNIILQTVKLIAEKRPELKSRLPSLEGAQPDPRPMSRIDTSIADEMGVTFTPFEKCLFDTVDALLQKENNIWKQ